MDEGSIFLASSPAFGVVTIFILAILIGVQSGEMRVPGNNPDMLRDLLRCRLLVGTMRQRAPPGLCFSTDPQAPSAHLQTMSGLFAGI